MVIRTENLAKIYPSGDTVITVFRDLNLEVYAGERLALVGASGAGKSTLLYLLGCLDRASEGTIYFGSKGISHLSDAELSEFRNREIGFVWQSHSLLPEFTAVENVMMPLLIRGVPRVEAKPAALELLAEVGLAARTNNRAGELSGGEQQRVGLARALVTRPKVLLADEPTGSLDHRTGEGVMELVERLQAAHRLTCILVTHNLSFARRCDRVLLLDNGQLRPFLAEPLEAQTTGTNGSNYV